MANFDTTDTATTDNDAPLTAAQQHEADRREIDAMTEAEYDAYLAASLDDYLTGLAEPR